MEPIVIQQRCDDVLSPWTTHKTACIQSTNNLPNKNTHDKNNAIGVRLTGTIRIQTTLRNTHRRVRLSFRDFSVRVAAGDDRNGGSHDDDGGGGGEELENENGRERGQRGDAAAMTAAAGDIPRLQLFLFETGGPEAWTRSDVAGMGFWVRVPPSRDGGDGGSGDDRWPSSLNDLFDDRLPVLNGQFDVTVVTPDNDGDDGRRVIGAVGFVIAGVTVDGHFQSNNDAGAGAGAKSLIVYGTGEFRENTDPISNILKRYGTNGHGIRPQETIKAR